MRLLSFASAALCLCAAACAHAAAISPDELKTQAEFNKAYRVNDKEQRKKALSMLEGAKHPSSWQILMSIAGSDPEAEVRLAAVTILAKEPARDGSLARMLVQLFNAVKFNDADGKLNVAKAMAPSEFKYEISAALAEHLSKLRYPPIPPLMQMPNGQTNQQQIKNNTKIEKEFDDLLEAFNAIANSDVSKPSKDAPLQVGKWFQANGAKLAAADKELADRYKKEDADAAKAAKDAAEAAKAKK